MKSIALLCSLNKLCTMLLLVSKLKTMHCWFPHLLCPLYILLLTSQASHFTCLWACANLESKIVHPKALLGHAGLSDGNFYVGSLGKLQLLYFIAMHITWETVVVVSRASCLTVLLYSSILAYRVSYHGCLLRWVGGKIMVTG